MKSFGILFLILLSGASMNAQHLLEPSEFAGTVNTGKWTVEEVTYVPDPAKSIGLFVKGPKKVPQTLHLTSPEKDISSLFKTDSPTVQPIVLKISHLTSMDRVSGSNLVAFTALRVEFIRRADDTLLVLYDCVATRIGSAANSRTRHESNIRNALQEAFALFNKESRTEPVKSISDEGYLYRPPTEADTLFPVLTRNALPNGAIRSFMELRAIRVDTSFGYTLRDLPNYPGELWPGPQLRKDQWPPFIVSDNVIHMHVGNRYTRVHEGHNELYINLVGPPLPPGGSGSMVGISFGGVGVSVPTKGSNKPEKTPCFTMNLNSGELQECTGTSDNPALIKVYIVHERTSKLPITIALNDEESVTLQPGQHLMAEVDTARSDAVIRFTGDAVEPEQFLLQLNGNLEEAVRFSTNKTGQLQISVLENSEKAEVINSLKSDRQVRFRFE
jgi:hypothetical protein